MTPNPQYPGQPASAPQGTSGLAIAALITGIVGVCLPCPFGLVSVGLGIAALVKINRTPGLGGMALAIIGIVLPVIALPIYTAIAIPNFIKFQARSKQMECRANLKSAYTAEMACRAEKDQLSPRAGEIGFSPERGNRYAYFLGGGRMEERSAGSLDHDEQATGVNIDTFRYPRERPLSLNDLPELAGGLKPGVHGQCPDGTFVAACAGNVDNHATLDVWSISSAPRTGAKGETIQPGEPYNDVNDTAN